VRGQAGQRELRIRRAVPSTSDGDALADRRPILKPWPDPPPAIQTFAARDADR
jgi:hypothetical protein